MRIAIVGNGILGLQTAYRLLNADSTLQLTLIGPSQHPGCASLAAAAMFNSFCEVDTRTLTHPIERQRFLFNKSANAFWPDLLKQIAQRSGVALEYGFGTFLINNHVSDSLEDDNFAAVLKALKEFNEPYNAVEPSDIPQYKPVTTQRVSRAIYLPREGWVNPVLLMQGLQRILENSGRVRFVDGFCQRLILNPSREGIAAVELLSQERLEADHFVLCPGAHFSRIVENSKLGIELLKVFYGVGATILLKTAENTSQKCIRTPNRGLACGIYSTPHDPQHTIIGASNLVSAEPIPYVRLSSVYALFKSAMEQINSDYHRSEFVRVNVGWRPTSADTLPLIGRTSLPNLIVATGTRRDGLHCSPVIANSVADLLLKGKSQHDLSLFNPERQAVRLYAREEAIAIAVKHTLTTASQQDFVAAQKSALEDLKQRLTEEFSALHDQVGAGDWGIPPELIEMYRAGHLR